MIYAYIIWVMFAVLKKMKTLETINFLQLVINAETTFIINTGILKDAPVGYMIMMKMIFVNVVIYIKKTLNITDVFILKKLNFGDYVIVNSHFSQYLIIIPCL